jgi:hypothetical protein
MLTGRLNGWQRIGVVLSVCWILGGFIWGANQVGSEATIPAEAHITACYSANVTDLSACNAAAAAEYTAALDGSHRWAWGFAFATIPVVLAWLLGWGLIAVIRWIIAGGFKT